MENTKEILMCTHTAVAHEGKSSPAKTSYLVGQSIYNIIH